MTEARRRKEELLQDEGKEKNGARGRNGESKILILLYAAATITWGTKKGSHDS